MLVAVLVFFILVGIGCIAGGFASLGIVMVMGGVVWWFVGVRPELGGRALTEAD